VITLDRTLTDGTIFDNCTMKNTAAMDPGLVDSLRHSGHDTPRTAVLPALWETLRESMGSFLADSWEENMKCI
jgi:hypothetical protein